MNLVPFDDQIIWWFGRLGESGVFVLETATDKYIGQPMKKAWYIQYAQRLLISGFRIKNGPAQIIWQATEVSRHPSFVPTTGFHKKHFPFHKLGGVVRSLDLGCTAKCSKMLALPLLGTSLIWVNLHVSRKNGQTRLHWLQGDPKQLWQVIFLWQA